MTEFLECESCGIEYAGTDCGVNYCPGCLIDSSDDSAELGLLGGAEKDVKKQ